jgi:glycosyltransferase involved in cell wall biosynthesis
MDMGKKRKKRNRTDLKQNFDKKGIGSKKTSIKAHKISACMIVKNEEELLPQCLESIKDFVDEIIIVDTGSKDRTVEIAESHGAKVYHHPWENDFSKHRNQSISYASYDWILIMDADEAFFPQDAPNIKRIVQETRSDFLYLQCYDLEKTGAINGFFNQVRLFKNNLGMHYTKTVHNQLQTIGKGEYTRLRFKHYGYDLSPEKMEAKHIRTTNLLKEMLEINPEDAYSRHQLAASYSMHREYSKVIEHGEMALDIMRRKKLRNEFFFTTFYLVAKGYYTLNETASAERVCLEALEFFDMHLDICHILAAIYFKRRSIEQCRIMSLCYLRIYEQLDDDPSLIGSGSCYCYNKNKRSEIFMGLACVHFLEKDYETADIYFRKAFDDSGRHMEKAENVYRFYLEQHMDEKAMQWLMAAYESGCSKGETPGTLQNHSNLYLKIGKKYLQQGDPNAAQECLEHTEDNHLTLDEKLEKRLLQIWLFWSNGAIDDLIQKLESLMTFLGLNTDRCLNSFDDLGMLVYDIVELLCERRQWHLAEPALNLAIQIAPSLFEPEKFQQLLAGASQ